MAEFRYVHMARKVVGVGSVGTRAWIVLLRGRDDDDPLLLQAKQAEASVLERFLPPSEYDHHGERVVRGQRLMQAASDLFLGWQRHRARRGRARLLPAAAARLEGLGRPRGDGAGGGPRLRERLRRDPRPRARALGRSGRDRLVPRLGRPLRPGDRGVRRDYADQNERDYAAFLDAVASGRLEAAASV